MEYTKTTLLPLFCIFLLIILVHILLVFYIPKKVEVTAFDASIPTSEIDSMRSNAPNSNTGTMGTMGTMNTMDSTVAMDSMEPTQQENNKENQSALLSDWLKTEGDSLYANVNFSTSLLDLPVIKTENGVCAQEEKKTVDASTPVLHENIQDTQTADTNIVSWEKELMYAPVGI